MPNNIILLHLSPTDIRYDSRILKELKALESIDNTKLMAFGIDDDEGHQYSIDSPIYIRTFKLVTKKIKYLPRPIKYFVNLIEAIFRLTVPAIRLSPSIIHCHDTLFLPIALLVKFFCNSKIIYDAHELESDKAGQSKALAKFTLFIERISWKKINLLISVSPSIISWYNKNFSKIESELILNSPQLDITKKGVKSRYLRDKFNIPDEHKIFLYLGIIAAKGRGVEFYLDTFKRSDVKSHIVFVGYGAYSDEVKNAAANYHNIHYHEAVPHDKVVEVSTSADVGLCLLEPVSLSDYYCLPNKLFEYAFAGLYVLACDFPDIKELVDTYSLGSTCKLEINDIHDKISDIECQNIEHYNVNTEKLYPLSWAYQAEKLVRSYKSLLKQ